MSSEAGRLNPELRDNPKNLYLLTNIYIKQWGTKTKGVLRVLQSLQISIAKRILEDSNMEATEGSEEVEEEIKDNEEPSLYEIRGILVEIQITVSDIQRKQNHFAEESLTLRKDFNLQEMELASAKSDLEKVKKENTRLQRGLEDVRKKEARREEEREELYVL